MEVHTHSGKSILVKNVTCHALLKMHKDTVHLGMKNFYCQDCDFTESRKGNLRVHQQAVHLGMKLQCPECDFQTKKISYPFVHKQDVHWRSNITAVFVIMSQQEKLASVSIINQFIKKENSNLINVTIRQQRKVT